MSENEDTTIDLNKIYTTRTTSVDNGEGYWNYLDVEVLFNGEVIGKYQRQYASFYRTFYAFEHKGKHYALYSSDYQVTSLMSLPDCKHIANTESGFCPVDFYVPTFEDEQISLELYTEWLSKEEANEVRDEANIKRYKIYIERYKKSLELVGTMGAVAGCYWGDDSGGWKMQYLDIDPEKGKITIRDDVFGYFELSIDNIPLSEKITWDVPHYMNIPMNTTFNLNLEKKQDSTFSFYSFEGIKIGKERK